MATPKPGEIRCPTCHRSTPPAAFCTQCGSAIPSDARARPRGMDRDELQDRIRARRSGGEPYRRGGPAGDAGYERFEPEPEDATVRQERPADETRPDYFDDTAVPPPPARVEHADLTRDTDDWTTPAPPPAEDAAVRRVPDDSTIVDDDHAAAATAGAAAAARPDEPSDPYDYDDAVGYPYEYDAWEDRRDRRSGAGAFAILGFLALGVLALLGGALLAGVFNAGGDPVAQETPTPEIVESVAPSVSEAPSVAPSVAPSAAPSAQPVESGEPVVFPDGFVAEAQPCFPGSAGQSGCNSNGATNGGVVDIWVGFQNGNSRDVIGAAIIAPDGTTVGEGSIDLASIGCGSACNGYTWFSFRNLEAGVYQVRVTRNGDPASSTSFEVS